MVSKPPTPTRRQVLEGAATAAALMAGGGAAADAEARLPIVDTHVHVVERDPRFPFVPGPDPPPTEDLPPRTVLGLMNRNHVRRAVIVHDFYYGWDCRYAASVVRAHRDRFVGVCRVNPLADTAADDLDRWVRREGFVAVRLQPYDGPEGDW